MNAATPNALIAHTLATALMLVVLSGCASMATERLAENLTSAMLNQDDPDTVRAGAPAYLLLLDGLIEDNPNDRALLIAAARLYGAFASGLAGDEGRAKRLSNRARKYARKAACGVESRLCANEGAPFETFAPLVKQFTRGEIEVLYAYAVSWAVWIQARGSDWNALADLPKVELLLERVTDLDPGHDRGRAHLYLAVMRSQLPQSLGGKPEQGRRHFELALLYSEGQDLMVKLEYARHYARLVFDQPLHDRLLNEVIAADPVVPDLTLSNILAQKTAATLLQDDYF